MFADFADAVRAALGGEAFASAWAEGRVMALEQAIAEGCEGAPEKARPQENHRTPMGGTGARAA
jgi:hypothetical protein